MKKFLIIVGACTSVLVCGQVPKSTGSKVAQAEAQEALEFHNKVRKDVGTAPLEWSVDLAKYAQVWADNLAKKNCAFEHRPRSGEFKQVHGENIFWGGGAEYNATYASKSWYSEIEIYKHEPVSESNYKGVGHYTQMVWKNTKKVGIAKATCKTGETLIVANYDPPGNYIGEKAY